MNNAKEHVKLYKSKKAWVAAVVTAAALGVAGVSVSSVNADVLPASIVKNEPASVKAGQHPNDKVADNMQYNTGIDPLTDKALKDETPAQQQKASLYMDEINGTSVSNSQKQTVASSNVASSSSNAKTSSATLNGGTTAGKSTVSDRVAANLDYSRGIDPLTDQALKSETPAQQQRAKEYVDALNKGETVAQAKNEIGLNNATQNSTGVVNNKGVQKGAGLSANKQAVVANDGKSTVNNQQKAENTNSVSNSLPTTGESQSKDAVALGMGSVSLGLALGGLTFLKRKKNN